MKRGAIVALDTFTWQMLASVFWPGSFIRCVVNATRSASPPRTSTPSGPRLSPPPPVSPPSPSS